MSPTISSRTPEGEPNHCPVCATWISVEPSRPPGDAPCPNCGVLLWFSRAMEGMRIIDFKEVSAIRDRVVEIVRENLGLDKEQVANAASSFDDLGVDSLDLVELVMELEEEFGITIPDEEAEKIKTVGEAIDFFVRRGL